jgi:DNA-directed RNA polymerase I and III subunit RPAC2
MLTQILDSTCAVDALEKGLDDLMDLCDAVAEKFTSARDEFNANKATEK